MGRRGVLHTDRLSLLTDRCAGLEVQPEQGQITFANVQKIAFVGLFLYEL